MNKHHWPSEKLHFIKYLTALWMNGLKQIWSMQYQQISLYLKYVYRIHNFIRPVILSLLESQLSSLCFSLTPWILHTYCIIRVVPSRPTLIFFKKRRGLPENYFVLLLYDAWYIYEAINRSSPEPTEWYMYIYKQTRTWQYLVISVSLIVGLMGDTR